MLRATRPLGASWQVNFFLEFDVCFFLSLGVFKVRPKP